MLRGKIRPGSDSPSRQFQELILHLQEHLPGVRMTQALDRDIFSIDLTAFAPPPPSADSAAEEEGQ